MEMVVEELEFLVHYNRPMCVALPAGDVTLAQLKARVQERAGVPVDRLELLFNGLKLGDDDELPTAPAIVRARMTDGLLGGKGGFGAMLRSSGKGASGKATTNFGACRDLNGRRLRHVNQEIAMDKWRQESSEREKRKKLGITDQELMDEETPSGIPGWYLATPSWADGVKKSYMKRRRNTAMCRHWVQAREDGRTPPPNAPRWWGCPRGRDCDFAHGEEELRGEALTDYKRQKKDEAYQKKQHALNRYVNYEQDVTIDIRDAVRQGMRNRSNGNAKLPVVVAPVVEELPTAPVRIEIPERWLASVNDSVATTFKHGLCELRGAGNFGTATVSECQIIKGKWYYEVRLITDGIIQLGWADAAFTANSESGDGVGDHERSWAYDGCRQLKWNGGKESEYGQEWESGDIIGCLLDADAGTIQFSRNGETMESAFTSIRPTKAAKNDKSGFYPAISIEKTEIVLINIGAQPFLYLPSGYTAVAEALPSKPTEKVVEPEPEKKNVEATHATDTKKTNEEPPVELLDLEKFDSAEALETLSLDTLKQQLQVRKLKCGGTLSDRAKRLFSVKGKSWDEIDPKIKDLKALRK